jgi:hypothetical protein
MLPAMRASRLVRWIAVFSAAALLGAAADEKLENGPIKIEFHGGRGMGLCVRDVPLLRASSIQIHEPSWKDGYYSSNNTAQNPQFDPANRRIVIHHTIDKNIKLDATETIQFVGDNHIDITLAGKFDGDVEAKLEWAIGYANAWAFYGGSYCDRSPGASTKPVTIEREKSSPGEQPAVISNASAIQLKSAAGTLLCKLESGDAKLCLLDGRRASQRWWAQDSPTFWLGCTGVAIEPGKPFEFRASIEVTPAAPPEPAADLTAEVKPRPVDQAYAPPVRRVQVIPKPKRMELTVGGAYVLDRDQRIWAEDAALPAAQMLAERLNHRFGMQTDAAGFNRTFEPSEPQRLRFSRTDDGSIKPEGYLIRCKSDAIEVRASDPAGFRHAAQTLLQLAAIDPDSASVKLLACEIDDEPSLAFRGVHLFPGKDSLQLHRKLIENVFAAYKFNHVVLECEYAQWDSARGIWTDISVPKEQLAEYAKLCRENGLELIPLVSSLGHASWMFKNDQNLDIAEDPAKPYAYNATDPRSWQFMDRIYEEAVALFKPKYFHIGHDEVILFGKYPNRDESKQWGVTRLFLHDVAHWDEFLKQRHMQMMLWGDMILHKSEIHDGAATAESVEAARERRDKLPKNAVICDWHYDGKLKPDEFNSLKLFADAGFTKVIASTWFNPQNIYNFAQAARMYGAWGLLQTTWAGYDIDEAAVDREFKQFAAYSLAAEYAWSADSPPPDKLTWSADEVIARALSERPEPVAPKAGFTIDLSNASEQSGDALALKLADRIGGFMFARQKGAIRLSGALLSERLPTSATVRFHAGAGELAFLHATSFPASLGETVGRYEITFNDNSVATVPLIYGRNIRAWDDPGAARDASPSRSASGATVYCTTWRNASGKQIVSIRFVTDHAYASPILLGITGIND